MICVPSYQEELELLTYFNRVMERIIKRRTNKYYLKLVFLIDAIIEDGYIANVDVTTTNAPSWLPDKG